MGLRGRGVIVVAVAVAFSVTTAGCSSDPEPDVTPTPTLSSPVVEESSPPPEPTSEPTPSPEPTPTALTDEEVLAAIPDELLFEDFSGAVEFARYFVELYPAMFDGDGDTRLFAALSNSECSFCTDAVSSAIATAEADAYSAGSDFLWGHIFDAQGGLREDGFWYVSQSFEVTSVTTYAADGSVLSEDEAGSGNVGVKLAWDEGRWRVHGVEFQYDDAN